MPASQLVLSWSAPDLTALTNYYLLIYASGPESPGRTLNATKGYKLVSKVRTDLMLDGHSYDLTADWETRYGMSISALTGAQIFLKAHLVSPTGIAAPVSQGSAIYAPQAVDPSTVSGMLLRLQADVIGTLWQDSARTTPVIADGNPVGAWDSTSPSLQSLLQASAGQRPTYKSASYHGKPTVRFDGVNDSLRLASATVLSQPLTAYMVVSMPAATGTDQVLMSSGNTSVVQVEMLLPASSSPALFANSQITAPSNVTGPQVLAFVASGTSSRIFRNGGSIRQGDAGPNSTRLLTLGASNAGVATLFAAIDTSEVIWYQGAHPITLVAGISQWLTTHWA